MTDAKIHAAPRSPFEAALDAVGDRGRLLIVWHLFWGPRPFVDLMRKTAGITKKALRHALVEMESHGLVRRDFHFGAGTADYSLTPLGETLKPIVASLYEWGLHSKGFPVGAVPFSGRDKRTTGAVSRLAEHDAR